MQSAVTVRVWAQASPRAAPLARLHASRPGLQRLAWVHRSPVQLAARRWRAAHTGRQLRVRARADKSWKQGGGMPPPGKLFAEPEDYGDDFEDITAQGARRVGAVKYYNADKGFGFLKTDTGEEFFVHISNVVLGGMVEALTQDALVEFTVKESFDGRLQAFEVTEPGGGPIGGAGDARGSSDGSADFGDGDARGPRAGAAGEVNVDFNLLGQLFEVKGKDDLPEVLWYLNVFLRSVGYEEGLEGRMSWKLLKALGRLNKAETARDVFDALPYREVNEYMEMVCVYFRQGPEGLDPGVKLLQEMQERGLEPPALTYTRIVHHLTKTGQSSAAAPFMEELAQSGDAEKRAQLEQCFTKLIRGFIEEENPQGALGAIQEKEEAGFELTPADFCQVIGGFGRDGEWNMALELLRTMHETGPPPDATTYLTVINTLKSAGRWEETMAVLRQLRRKETRGSIGQLAQVYSTVMQFMLDSKKNREAMEVVGYVEEDRILTDARFADLIYRVEQEHWSSEGGRPPSRQPRGGDRGGGASWGANNGSGSSASNEDREWVGDFAKKMLAEMGGNVAAPAGGTMDKWNDEEEWDEDDDDWDESWDGDDDDIPGLNLDEMVQATSGASKAAAKAGKAAAKKTAVGSGSYTAPPAAVRVDPFGSSKSFDEDWDEDEDWDGEDEAWPAEEPMGTFSADFYGEAKKDTAGAADAGAGAGAEAEAEGAVLTRAQLDGATVPALKAYAKDLGIKGYSKLKKVELLEVLGEYAR